MMRVPDAIARAALTNPLDGKSKLNKCMRPVNNNQIPNNRKPKFLVTFTVYPPWVDPIGRIRLN
jgi:hypothetical protein